MYSTNRIFLQVSVDVIADTTRPATGNINERGGMNYLQIVFYFCVLVLGLALGSLIDHSVALGFLLVGSLAVFGVMCYHHQKRHSNQTANR